MDMLYARPMPVADHFMASCTNADGQTAAEVYLGEVCETCYAYCAAGKTELWRHARDEHSADPSLSCHVPGCGRRFFAAAMCTDHRAHHRSDGHHDIESPNDRPPLTCELCGLLSCNPSKYNKHMNTAHPEALAAICGVCHSYEGDVSSLIGHVQRQHALEICADIMTETTDIESDPKRRSRRSIRCTVCGKRCSNNRNMYNHRKVHCLADDVDNVQPQ